MNTTLQILKITKTKEKFCLYNKIFISYELNTHTRTHTHTHAHTHTHTHTHTHSLVSLNNFCPSKPLMWSVIFFFYIPAVVCRHARVPSSLHHWNILIKSLAMFITHITHQDFINLFRFSAKKSKWEWNEWTIDPYHDNDSADHSPLAYSLLNDGCPGSYGKLSWFAQR